MMYGIDALGAAKYSDLIIREWPANWAFGGFCNTFGNIWPTVQKLAATGRCPRIRVHAIWEDNHRYDPRKHDPIIMRELKQANKLAALTGIEVQFSPFCEHNIKGAQLEALLEKVLNAAKPEIVIVNSVWQGDLAISMGRVINEVHGDHKSPGGLYNYSFDGTACEDADAESTKAKHSAANTFYFWSPRFNGKWESNDKTPRPVRKGWPDSNLIDSIIALGQARGAITIPKKWLYKSHAENKGNGDPRAEKPVWIIPLKAKSIELRCRNGQVVDVAKAYGTFIDGRYRYYSNQWGFLTAEKARRIQGDPLCEVFVNNKKQGIINPSFRSGEFK